MHVQYIKTQKNALYKYLAIDLLFKLLQNRKKHFEIKEILEKIMFYQLKYKIYIG